jgi:hypothetical protein
METLKDVGYEVLDCFYVPEFFMQSIRTYLAVVPKKLCFAISEDFAVRLFGGYSLMVLAR